MLHPEARALLDLLEQRGVPPTHTLTPAEARTAYRERRALTQPEPSEVAEVRELEAAGPHGTIPLRLYRPRVAFGAAPTGSAVSATTVAAPHAAPHAAPGRPHAAPSAAAAPLPVLVYFHGGGWVIGDLDTHDTLCRELANGSGCAVIAVDYRLAPEHRFPIAVDDCLAATYWVQREAAALGLDPQRIAVGGDSAGGNLAAVVALAARDAGDLALAFQLLIYPATDMRAGHPSHTRNGSGFLLTRESIAYYHDHYIADRTDDLDWRASPLLHADLARLPPALVVTAGYDPLRDEGLAYAEALTAAGNRASHACFERQIHGFILMGRVLDEANTAVALCAAELRRALQR